MNPKKQVRKNGVSARSIEHYLDAALYEATFKKRKHDVAYFVQLAQGSGGPVLEYGAGAGRVTLALARGGIDVVAVDPSRPMLERLQAKLARMPQTVRQRVTVVRGDMRKATGLGKFPLVLATFNVVGHLETFEDMRDFLACARSHLARSGELCFDVPVPAPEELEADPDELHAAPRFKHPLTGQWIRQTERFEYDPIRQLLLVESELHVEGSRETLTVPLVLRQWFPRELEAALHYAGFADVRLHADYSEAPALGDVDMLVVRARVERSRAPS